MIKTYLACYDYDRCVFIRAKSEIDAIIYLAEYCNGGNEVFNKAARSMENLMQLLELYAAFYHEILNIFLEVNTNAGFYDDYIDWIGDVE